MLFQLKIASQLVPYRFTAFARRSNLDSIYATRTFIQCSIYRLRATLHRFQAFTDTFPILSDTEDGYDSEFAKLLEVANSLPYVDKARIKRATVLTRYAPGIACNIIAGELRRVLYAQLWRLNDHLWLTETSIAGMAPLIASGRRRRALKNYVRWFVRRCCHPADAFSRAAIWITGPMEGALQRSS
jgi:hypothetical protein